MTSFPQVQWLHGGPGHRACAVPCRHTHMSRCLSCLRRPALYTATYGRFFQYSVRQLQTPPFVLQAWAPCPAAPRNCLHSPSKGKKHHGAHAAQRTRSALQQELGAARPVPAQVFQRVVQKWHASTRGWHSALTMISNATRACPSVAVSCCHLPGTRKLHRVTRVPGTRGVTQNTIAACYHVFADAEGDWRAYVLCDTENITPACTAVECTRSEMRCAVMQQPGFQLAEPVLGACAVNARAPGCGMHRSGSP